MKSDGKAVIPVGGVTTESTVVFQAKLDDPDGKKVKLQIELRKLAEYGGQFLGRFTQEGDLVPCGGEAIAAAYGLVNDVYHWQARTVNEKGQASDWVSFGGNPESDADLRVRIDEPPIASFTYTPKIPVAGQATQFDASESKDPDGGSIVSYVWDFGDGQSITTVEPQVSYTYPSAADYALVLTVRDDEGSEDQCSREVYVLDGGLVQALENLVNKTNDGLGHIVVDAIPLMDALDYFNQNVDQAATEVVVVGVEDILLTGAEAGLGAIVDKEAAELALKSTVVAMTKTLTSFLADVTGITSGAINDYLSQKLESKTPSSTWLLPALQKKRDDKHQSLTNGETFFLRP